MGSFSRYIDDFNVAGMRFWDGASVLHKLKVGNKLKLVYEQGNPYDPDAVALYRKGVKIGYIPRKNNAFAAQLLRFGHGKALECRILKIDKKAQTWDQVHVGLYISDKRKG